VFECYGLWWDFFDGFEYCDGGFDEYGYLLFVGGC